MLILVPFTCSVSLLSRNCYTRIRRMTVLLMFAVPGRLLQLNNSAAALSLHMLVCVNAGHP